MRITDRTEVRRLLRPNPVGGSVPEWVFDQIADRGALLQGHFRLQSGDHSKYFLRFAELGWVRELRDRLAELLASRRNLIKSSHGVICSEAAGVFLGESIAHLSGGEMIVYAVDLRKRPIRAIRRGRGTLIGPAILVSDVITRGNGIRMLRDLSRELGAKVESVLAFAALRPDDLLRFLRTEELTGDWLVEATWETHEASNCPLCDADEPLILAHELA